MPDAAERLERWIAAGCRHRLRSTRSAAALDDDLDTPGAVAAIDAAARAGLGVSDAASLLGVDVGRPIDIAAN